MQSTTLSIIISLQQTTFPSTFEAYSYLSGITPSRLFCFVHSSSVQHVSSNSKLLEKTMISNTFFFQVNVILQQKRETIGYRWGIGLSVSVALILDTIDDKVLYVQECSKD